MKKHILALSTAAVMLMGTAVLADPAPMNNAAPAGAQQNAPAGGAGKPCMSKQSGMSQQSQPMDQNGRMAPPPPPPQMPQGNMGAGSQGMSATMPPQSMQQNNMQPQGAAPSVATPPRAQVPMQ